MSDSGTCRAGACDLVSCKEDMAMSNWILTFFLVCGHATCPVKFAGFQTIEECRTVGELAVAHHRLIGGHPAELTYKCEGNT